MGKFVTLPLQPLEAWFEDIPRGTPGGLGPTDYLLVAVMRFDRGALAEFCKGAPGREADEPAISSLANRPWFPPQVKAAMHSPDANGVAIRGTTFDGAPFAKGSFLMGSFVVVEGGEYVVVVMETS